MFGMNPGVAVFLFLAIASIALFSFLAVATWTGTRSNEREVYYKNETIKKIVDSPGPGADAALAYLREQHRQAEINKREGLRLGGLITAAVGLGVMIFLRAMVHAAPVYVAGIIPLLIGIALFGYAFTIAPQE
ncbi:MAG TPA: hypothetical protein VHX63_10705 [Acidobacteriaceae bacterium]|jgi:hypothetical protein|nr:hypothetical protein [Acidobacteriaceae bacterium]